MLDEKDLQAISGLFDQKIDSLEQRITKRMDGLDQQIDSQEQRMDEKLEQKKSEIMREVSVLMESKFQPQFNLLAEGQRTILDKLKELTPKSKSEEMEADIILLKEAVKQHSQEIRELKKAK